MAVKKIPTGIKNLKKKIKKQWQESCDYYDSGKPNWDPFKF